MAENQILRTLRRYNIELPLPHLFLSKLAGVFIVVVLYDGAPSGWDPARLLAGMDDDDWEDPDDPDDSVMAPT